MTGTFSAESEPSSERRLPSTRYQGSKHRLLDWIGQNLQEISYESALDAFGGTGAIAYWMKGQRKQVVYNDVLRFNHEIGLALIENSAVRLTDEEVDFILAEHADVEYDTVIADNFPDIYFTDDENRWLDRVCANILALQGVYQRALAYFALFQSCLIKRPYNLFHRKNLYMRLAEVARSFGNKAAWDRPFETHFRSFVAAANEAVFDSGVPARATCCDAREVPGQFDLVYIDTPYVSQSGRGVDYLDFYHFLEGMIEYPVWPSRIDRTKKHHPLIGERSPWSRKDQCKEAFAGLFRRFADSILVVSYRDDGIPSIDELAQMLGAVKSHVRIERFGSYQYALSKNRHSREVLLIGT